MKKNIIRHKKNTKKIILFLIAIVFMFGLLWQITMGNHKNVIKTAMSGILKNFASNSNAGGEERFDGDYGLAFEYDDSAKTCTITMDEGITKLSSQYSYDYYWVDKYPEEAEKHIDKYLEYGYTEGGFTVKLVLPKTLKCIGNRAFSNFFMLCNGIVEIPSEVTEIGEQAFYTNLIKKLTLNDKLKTIGSAAFYWNSIEGEFIIPDSVEYIGDAAFWANNIESLKIGKELKKIGKSAFCKNFITSLELPKTIEEIGNECFKDNCLKEVKIYNKDMKIGSNAFSNQFKDNQRKEIQKLVIYGYKGSTAETYYNENKEEGNIEFKYLEEKTEKDENYDYVDEDGYVGYNLVNKIETGHMADVEIYILKKAPETIKLNIPDRISSYSIRGIHSITTEDQDKKVHKVSSISGPNTIKRVDENACREIGLTDSSFIQSLEEIGKNAFWGNNLKNITIGSKTTKIGENAFYGNKLKSVIIYSKDAEIGVNAFAYGFTSGAPTFIEEGLTIYGYKDSTADKNFNNESMKNKGVTFVAFGGEKKNKQAEFIIDELGFVIVNVIYEDSKVSELDIPESINNIPVIGITKIYANGHNVKSIKASDKLVIVKDNACENIGLEDASFCKNLQEIGKNAFAKNKITSVTISDKTKKILEGAYSNNDLKKVIIDNKDVTIEKSAFNSKDNSKLTIYGYRNSTAEKYAKSNNIKFEYINGIDEEDNPINEKNYVDTLIKWGEDNFSFLNDSSAFNSYDINGYGEYLNESLIAYVNDMIGGYWGGSCYGIALIAAMFYENELSQTYWEINQEETDTTYELDSTRYNQKLKGLINLYWALQHAFNDSDQLELLNSDDTSLQGFYNSVKSYYENGGDELLLYCFYFSTGNGHAILVTGAPETLDEEMKKSNDGIFSRYEYRIPVYDVNYDDQKYIYMTSNFNQYTMGNHLEAYSYNSITENKVYRIKYSNIANLEKTMKDGKDFEIDVNTIVEDENSENVTIQNKQGKYVTITKNPETETLSAQSGDLECEVTPLIGTTLENENVSSVTGISLANEDWYKIKAEDDTKPLEIGLLFGESYMEVKTLAGGSAEFENKNSVQLSNTSGQEYEIEYTLNKEYAKLPWYTLVAKGTKSKEIKMESTDEGVIVSGDDLKDLKINGKNLNQVVEVNAGTDKNKVLLKSNKDNTKLLAYIDKDGDGTFETLVGESKVVENNQVADNKGNVNKQVEKVSAGDKIKIFIITLVISIVILVVIIIKKNK